MNAKEIADSLLIDGSPVRLGPIWRELARAVLALWPVYEAAKRVQEFYRWTPSSELQPGTFQTDVNDLAEALAAAEEELR